MSLFYNAEKERARGYAAAIQSIEKQGYTRAYAEFEKCHGCPMDDFDDGYQGALTEYGCAHPEVNEEVLP